MDFEEHDLSLVAPHRRAEMRRRIRIIKEYISHPGVEAARKAAKELGMSESSLHLLVRAWRQVGRADALVGSGAPRKIRDQLRPEQKRIIQTIAEEYAGGVIQRAVEQALAQGATEGIQMPSVNALRNHLKKAIGRRVPADSFAYGADFAIDHVAVDLPIDAAPGGTEPVMPIATVVLDIANATVLGLNLSLDVDSLLASTAFALVNAFSDGFPVFGGRQPRLAMEQLPGDRWDRLSKAVEQLPFEPMFVQRPSLGRKGVAAALLGDVHRGVRLRPRLTLKPLIQRLATLPAGATPLAIDLADEHLRSRWCMPYDGDIHSGRLEAAALSQVHLVPLDRNLKVVEYRSRGS